MQASGGVDAGHGPAAPADAGAAAVAVAAVAAAVDGLQAADLSRPGTGELLDLLREVERQSRRLAAVSVAVIGQMDARSLAAPAGCRSTAALVRQVISIGKEESSRRTRLAAGVCPSTGLSGAAVPARFPLVGAAVAAGAVGVREAALICSTITGFPRQHDREVVVAAERFLVEQAAVLDPKTFQQTAREIALMANPDGTPDDRDAHEKMEFHLGSRREDGLTRCWGLLDDLTAEALRVVFGSMCSPSAERNHDRVDAQEPGGPGGDAGDGCGDVEDGDPEDGDPEDGDGEDGTSSPADGPQPDKTNTDVADGHPAEGEDVAVQPFLPVPGCEDAGPDTDPPVAGTGHHNAAGADDQAANTGPDSDTDEASAEPTAAAAGGRPPDPPPDPVPAAPTSSTGAAEGCPRDDSGRSAAADPVWRAPRLPYEWAPLGSVPSDYLSPERWADALPDGGATPAPEPPPDRRSAGTKRAQALSIIVSTFLDLGVAPTQGGHRPHLIVTIDEQSLTDRTRPARLGYGEQLPAGQLRMLACDAKIIPAVLRGTSEVLDVGRSMRTFTAACRTAILLRDLGCVFPGCDLPGRWAEFHHIQHWADGGPSDLHNGCLLCKRHHTLIHQEQWQARMGADLLPEIIPPTSHDLEQRPLRNTLHRPPTFAWPQVG